MISFAALLLVQSIDPDLARQYFTEAEAICREDSGRLWGISLCGPMLFADPHTRAVVTNRHDREQRLPDHITPANTAIEWQGTRWTMVMWPLPAECQARARLMMHELFRRIQPELGLPAANPANGHLDTRDGRLWLQLEWRALSRALAASGPERIEAIRDALRFRAERRRLFPGTAAEERALELNEGLAQYTGVRLCCGAPDAIRLLDQAPRAQSFVRSFAYASGPAYGLLLDDADPGWRKKVSAASDLGDMLAIAPADANRTSIYGGHALAAAEDERQRKRERLLSEYRARFVDGPVLVIKDSGKWQFTFDPLNVVPLPGHGSVYPNLRVTDAWGILTVTGGALMSGSFSSVAVPAPRDPTARPLRGNGWTLQPNQGWRLAPGARPGDYVLTPALQ